MHQIAENGANSVPSPVGRGMDLPDKLLNLAQIIELLYMTGWTSEWQYFQGEGKNFAYEIMLEILLQVYLSSCGNSETDTP